MCYLIYSYSKLVQKGMEKAELIIKVVMAPHEHAEEFLASYRKLMNGDTDVANFQKILEMKVSAIQLSTQYVILQIFLYHSSQLQLISTHTQCNLYADRSI